MRYGFFRSARATFGRWQIVLQIAGRSTLPTGLVVWQVVIGIIDFDRVAAVELLDVHHDIRAAARGLAGEEDAGVTVGQHQITEDPRGRLDVLLELKVTPVLTPIVPQLVLGFAVVKLAQIDQIAQCHGVGAHRAGW